MEGRVRVAKVAHQSRKTGVCFGCQLVDRGHLLAGLEALDLAGRLPSGQTPEGEFRDFRGRKPVKATLPRDRRLQRQLRREAEAKRLGARRRTGLVVDQRQPYVRQAFDPVGAGA